MADQPTRRGFLLSAPLASAGFALPVSTEALLAQAAPASSSDEFRFFSAGQLAGAIARLQATSGNDNLFQPPSLPVTIVLTVEQKKQAAEFEYHEGRDHILQVIDGATVYEVGGTPQSPRNIRPGEWLASSSKDATKLALKKGDMLVIPRGTPHKRTTDASVTFLLISASGGARP